MSGHEQEPGAGKKFPKEKLDLLKKLYARSKSAKVLMDNGTFSSTVSELSRDKLKLYTSLSNIGIVAELVEAIRAHYGSLPEGHLPDGDKMWAMGANVGYDYNELTVGTALSFYRGQTRDQSRLWIKRFDAGSFPLPLNRHIRWELVTADQLGINIGGHLSLVHTQLPEPTGVTDDSKNRRNLNNVPLPPFNGGE